MDIQDPARLPTGAEAPDNRILILGAGYAGLRCAQVLSKYFVDPGSPEVMLVDRNDYHQIITQLPEAVSGRLSADEVAVPLADLLKQRRVRFMEAEVQGIDLTLKQVRTSAGDIPYTTLVVALGSLTSFYGIPGLAEHALTLKSVEDAEAISRRVREAMAMASKESEPMKRASLLSFLVGGAGLTGVELAGELAEAAPTIAADYGIAPTEPRVTLVEAAPAVLPTMPRRLQTKAAGILAELGVRISLGGKVVRADDQGIDLSTGDHLVGGTLVWTGGIMAPPLLAAAGLPTVFNGYVLVDQYLQAAGVPDVYVVGDSASVPAQGEEGALAPTAQIALKQAEAASYNIVARWEGRQSRPYSPHDKGQVVSIGADRGVASVFHVPLVGKKVTALKLVIAESYRLAVTGRIGHRSGNKG
jgi:NADH:quinone reductase (non-electrogenic)